MRLIETGFAEARSYFAALPDVCEQAAVLAINQVAERDGMVAIRREMRSQIEFPGGYLESRMRVSRKASRGSLKAEIKGRDRATSLARFAEGQTPQNTRGRGVRVTVKKGQRQVLRNAFMVNLRNGNRGVAIRLKPGESPRNTDRAVRLADNVYLLYGPSVDQVFNGAVDDVSPDLGRMLSKQFLRQFTRLSARG